MKNRLLTTVAAIGAVTAFTHGALAADIIQEPAYIPPPPVPIVSVASGWYLRGDVGYVFSSSTDGYYHNPFYPGYGHTYLENYHYEDIRTDDAFSGGIGVGYRLNDFARLDLTGDYFSTDGHGRSGCAGIDHSFCHYEDSSDVDIWTLMANAYVDIFHYGVFTPYVGAGAGGAYVDYGDLHNKFACDFGTPPCGTTVTHQGQSSWRFAESLMAGVSVDLTERLKLDAGYKYTHIHGGSAFGYDEDDRLAGYDGVQGYDNGFNIHTIRAGLRYEFGGGGFGKGKAPVYPDAPLYDAPPAQPIVYK